jgi:hypothetical protein
LRAEEARRATIEPARGPAGALQVANAFFGPTITIQELFAYIGGAFLLAAWHVLAPRGDLNPPDLVAIGVRWFIPAIAFAGLGLFAARGSARLGRAAGVAFAVATAHVYGGFVQIWEPTSTAPLNAVTVTVLTVVAAAAFRSLKPAVLTQLTLIVAGLGAALATFDWLRFLVFGVRRFDAPPTSLVPQAVLTFGWWVAIAVVLAVIARREWRIGDDAPSAATETEKAAARRGRITRLFVGLTAVSGAVAATFVSGDGGRALAPFVGDGLTLVVSAALLGIAIRFESLSYLVPAAIGFITALSDLNGQYVAEETGTGAALILEGLILIGTGFLAERVRRRMRARRDPRRPPVDQEPLASPSET